MSSPGSATSGTPFSSVLIPKDAYGNSTTNVSNTTSFSVNKGSVSGPTIPASDFQGYVSPDSNVYAYKVPVTITNNVAQQLYNYQVKLTLDTRGLSQAASCNDMRFAETNGTNVSYWVENPATCNTASTTVWIKTSLSASAAKTIYFYYGNASASSASDGNSVFELFDDFNGSSVDTNKWTVNGATTSGGLAVINNTQGITQRWYIASPIIYMR